jgi:hypothetical protein
VRDSAAWNACCKHINNDWRLIDSCWSSTGIKKHCFMVLIGSASRLWTSQQHRLACSLLNSNVLVASVYFLRFRLFGFVQCFSCSGLCFFLGHSQVCGVCENPELGLRATCTHAFFSHWLGLTCQKSSFFSHPENLHCQTVNNGGEEEEIKTSWVFLNRLCANFMVSGKWTVDIYGLVGILLNLLPKYLEKTRRT